MIFFFTNCSGFSQEQDLLLNNEFKLFKKKEYRFFKLSDEVYSELFEKKLEERPVIIDTSKYHSAFQEYNWKSNMFIPIGEVIGLNFSLSAFNNYVGGHEYAKISFKSVKHNLDTGFVWDDDDFSMNQFGHPYHGNLYFNMARTNGHSFWESVPFAFGGSSMWEMFMETDPPQTNDIIQTSIGGAMLGEMTYRITSLILDESKTGMNRFFREFISTIINPVRGFNRLIRGEMSRHTTTNVNDVFPVMHKLNVGYAGINQTEKVKFDKSNLMLEYIFTYGWMYNQKEIKPFDFFRIRLGFDARKGDSPSSWVYAYGLLWGTNHFTKRKESFTFGAFHDYDFFYNSLYRLGMQSVGLGMIYRSPVDWKVRLMGSFHSNFVAMGAFKPIYSKEEVRDYDYTIGNKTMIEVLAEFGPIGLCLEYRFYYLKTVNGWAGQHKFGVLNPKILISIYKGFGLGAEYLFYYTQRHGIFENAERYNRTISEQRLYLSYFF